MNNDSNCVTSVEHEAPMKDETPTFLYTKEIHRLVRCATCSVSTEHIEQQSSRAIEHSAGHVT